MRKRHMPIIVTLALLGGLTAETVSRPRAKDAEPFHQHVRQLCAAMPTEIGKWSSTEVPIPPAATALLRPNAMVHRRFVEKETGRAASFLLVQCRDVRDMLGHYPPVCYPAHGWETLAAQPVEWSVGSKVIPGMEYTYSRVQEGQTFSCVVSNAMIIPDGRFVRSMSDLDKAAADYQRQFYGAAQVQVVLDGEIPPEERRQITSMLLGANMPVLEALSSGGTR